MGGDKLFAHVTVSVASWQRPWLVSAQTWPVQAQHNERGASTLRVPIVKIKIRVTTEAGTGHDTEDGKVKTGAFNTQVFPRSRVRCALLKYLLGGFRLNAGFPSDSPHSQRTLIIQILKNLTPVLRLDSRMSAPDDGVGCFFDGFLDTGQAGTGRLVAVAGPAVQPLLHALGCSGTSQHDLNRF